MTGENPNHEQPIKPWFAITLIIFILLWKIIRYCWVGILLGACAYIWREELYKIGVHL